MVKNKKQQELEQQVGELTADLQRLRADFENYRKRVDTEKSQARATGKSTAVSKLLPILDTIDRAVAHIPTELEEHPWAKGIAGVSKNLESAMGTLGLQRIDANTGTSFNPLLHEAIQMDEDAQGENEVIAEELQSGYLQDGEVLRPSMVKVTRK
jgi:molecular chaperone GrpE